MHVLVTGGAGKIGQEAMRALKAAGHRVSGIDLRAGSVDNMRVSAVDCADFGAVMGALSGTDTIGRPDAVVHLAGIPAPGLADDETIFRVNTLSTYNVFSASARLGIKRVAWASSETLLGLPFAQPPAFLPIDETHPDLPNWSYSLSKQMGETMADQFVRWHPDLVIVSLRFSNVFDTADYATRAIVDRRPDIRKLNLWGYVDARDAGEACRLAIDAPLTGHEKLLIAAADNVTALPSAELVSSHYAGVPLRRALKGHESLLSSARAERLIGYRPRHSWRDQA